MNAKTDRKLIVYSSLFITMALNMPRLLALRKEGIIAHFWHFNLAELLFQTLLNFIFCIALFYYNKDRIAVFALHRNWPRKTALIAGNILLFGLFMGFALCGQRFLFIPGLFPGGGNGLRFTVSSLLIAIELKILSILQTSEAKEIENEHLRNAYLEAELELLKGQLNPHFFFNSLSSLSAVVREDPTLAQYYIGQLSKVFRYSLQQTGNNTAPLKEEILAIQSYAALMKMRHEEGFKLTINIDEQDEHWECPHMSLQPLIENALKHNIVSAANPLYIEICRQDDFLEIKNNLQPVHSVEPGNGMALSNLNERCRILMQREIEISKTAGSFIVRLPLK